MNSSKGFGFYNSDKDLSRREIIDRRMKTSARAESPSITVRSVHDPSPKIPSLTRLLGLENNGSIFNLLNVVKACLPSCMASTSVNESNTESHSGNEISNVYSNRSVSRSFRSCNRVPTIVCIHARFHRST